MTFTQKKNTSKVYLIVCFININKTMRPSTSSFNSNISYSQNGQDLYVLNYLKSIGKDFSKKGLFIEVGAHDGKTLSNTKMFEDNGWRGICVEPIEERYKELVLERKNSICINGCASEEDGKVDFLKISGYAEMLSGIFSTYDKRHLSRIENEVKVKGGEVTKTETKTYRLESLIYPLGQDWTHIDYMSIDTEGSELQVLKGINFEKVKFSIISCEDNYPDDKRVEDFMKTVGYKLKEKFGGDNMFIPID